MADGKVPTLKWAILGTGWISTEFVKDLLLTRPDALANHSIVAIGSSSTTKGNEFVDKLWKDSDKPRPKVYGDYQSVYTDPEVQIVYIGTPHAVHKQNCLDAIAAGKHVMNEKPFAINEAESLEIIDAAKKAGVFLMEAVWTRFFPLALSLQKHLFETKSIGTINRMMCDFGLNMPMDTLPATSRLKDPALGAGALLDVGIYSLTYAALVMGEGKLGKSYPDAKVTSSLTIKDGIDYSDVVILDYPSKTAICTATLNNKTGSDFCIIEGTEGSITVYGVAASLPSGYRIKKLDSDKEETFDFTHPGSGYYYEADAVALDISQGRTENAIMPLDETIRMMKLMDSIRFQNGLKYPQDK